MCQQEVIFQFTCGTHGYLQKSPEIRIGIPPAAFSDIGWN